MVEMLLITIWLVSGYIGSCIIIGTTRKKFSIIYNDTIYKKDAIYAIIFTTIGPYSFLNALLFITNLSINNENRHIGFCWNPYKWRQ